MRLSSLIVRLRPFAFCTAVSIGSDRLWANDPGPTQSVSPDGNGYHAPIPADSPFPSSSYGALHNGSSFSLTYPFTGPFGSTDHARGRFIYNCASFLPRNSEGVFGIDVWLEAFDGASWSPVGFNGGIADGRSGAYQSINTPNPGPSPSYAFTWTFDSNHLPSNTSFRVFVYVYIYNQGGSNQGVFPVYSATQSLFVASANDAPRINWTTSFGSTNPAQVTVGQSYTISADGQDDNGNLVAVSINKNGQPFAYAGGGNGYSGNSQNPNPNDPVGTYTYTAWSTDSTGAQSPTITWTVNVLPKPNQASVSSSNASLQFWRSFTPSYVGGSGTGGWQFVVSGYSNWDAGATNNVGTKLSPSNVWSGSWTPPNPGNYQFYVARNGDANFQPSAIAGPYSLTVSPGSPAGSFDGVAPGSVVQGQAISGSGWALSPQLGAPLSLVQIRVDGGTNGTFSAILGGSRPDVQTANTSWGQWSPYNVTNSGWSFTYNTAGLSPGSHSFTAVAYDNSYGVSTTLGSQGFSVSPLSSQSVSVTPVAPTITAGGTIGFSASGGQNGYVWGGTASGSGSGSAKSVTFPTIGTYSVTVYSPAGGNFLQSNVATSTVTVTTAGQTVAISPTAPAITASQSVTFTASGGANGYIWGGSASGSGVTQTITFPNPGTYSVTVYSPAGGNYAQSNPAISSVTVGATAQSVAISPTVAVTTAGGILGFSATGGQNGYVWGGAASGSGATQSVSFPNIGNYSVTVYSPAGGVYAQSSTATASVTVNPAAQTVSVTPVAPSIDAGQSILFTASGGLNGYVWGGSASGSGSSKTVTFPDPGNFSATVYSPAGGNFVQSNTAGSSVTVRSLPAPSAAGVIVKPKGGEVKIRNSRHRGSSQVIVP